MGSTAVGIPRGEHNRRAKLKQLSHDTPISAELSLRYWRSTGTITHYSTIHISTHSDYDQAWTHKHLYISKWQPTLNWPFISQHTKLKADGWQFTRHRAHFYPRLANHFRLFRRLRRHTSHKLHALTVLRGPPQIHQSVL